ncbi:MAG: hypothetical protein UV94_C0039G0004 [Parcubacteria group bacterium GW2011_GWC1_43_30]|nr:MAG: hypothetical protein UV94_C0039G0004 [Parcubacteria group bacterium GW2011_GWC1_43_30]
MTETQNPKKYDLEERTFEFAKRVRAFVKNLSKTVGNIEDGKQVVRSSGSQAANYIEANEALSKKDFIMRVKISRKETKESELWLKLCEINDTMENERQQLLQEALELRKIFGSIIEKSK